MGVHAMRPDARCAAGAPSREGTAEPMATKDELAQASLVEDASERRNFDRYEVEWAVDCVASDTFLFASITNISEMGIFVKTIDPLAIGTKLRLAFAPPGSEPFKLDGCVAWVNPLRANGDNPNPGMGIRFVELTPANRERLVEVIRTIAYLRPYD
jgi:type IV pilus assembly protein PilZ